MAAPRDWFFSRMYLAAPTSNAGAGPTAGSRGVLGAGPVLRAQLLSVPLPLLLPRARSGRRSALSGNQDRTRGHQEQRCDCQVSLFHLIGLLQTSISEWHGVRQRPDHEPSMIYGGSGIRRHAKQARGDAEPALDRVRGVPPAMSVNGCKTCAHNGRPAQIRRTPPTHLPRKSRM